MTATATNSISSVANLEFNLDGFPPPRPSTAASLSPMKSEGPTSTPRVPPGRFLPSQLPSTSSSRVYGLPSNPRSPLSPHGLEKGVRRFAPHRSQRGFRRALSSIFVNRSEPELGIPIRDASPEGSTTHGHENINFLPQPPLHIEKRAGTHSDSCQCADPKRRKRRRLLLVALAILLLYLLGDSIFLNTRVISNDNRRSLSAAQESCLTQFTINAPANASLYPCSTCLDILQGIHPSSKSLTADDVRTLSNGIQFCGLQSLLVASGGNARSSLANGGWVQDTKFCTWTGVQCDGEGNVQSLQMVFPAVPSVIPSGISALTSLQSLQIRGGNNVPAGAIPDGFANLTLLRSLDLESTGLSMLPSSVFDGSRLGSLTSLTLVKNPGLAGVFPDVSQIPLQSLIVDSQSISRSVTDLLNSTTIQTSLTTLSLTSTNLTGSFPSSSSTDAFANLQTLSLANNSALVGDVPDAICTSTKLEICDLRGTGLTGSGSGGSCGPCLFGR